MIHPSPLSDPYKYLEYQACKCGRGPSVLSKIESPTNGPLHHLPATWRNGCSRSLIDDSPKRAADGRQISGLHVLTALTVLCRALKTATGSARILIDPENSRPETGRR